MVYAVRIATTGHTSQPPVVRCLFRFSGPILWCSAWSYRGGSGSSHRLSHACGPPRVLLLLLLLLFLSNKPSDVVRHRCLWWHCGLGGGFSVVWLWKPGVLVATISGNAPLVSLSLSRKDPPREASFLVWFFPPADATLQRPDPPARRLPTRAPVGSIGVESCCLAVGLFDRNWRQRFCGGEWQRISAGGPCSLTRERISKRVPEQVPMGQEQLPRNRQLLRSKSQRERERERETDSYRWRFIQSSFLCVQSENEERR